MKLNICLNPSIERVEVDNEIVLLDKKTQTICVANETMRSIVDYLVKDSTNIIQLKEYFFSLYHNTSSNILNKDFDNALQLLTSNNIVEYVIQE